MKDRSVFIEGFGEILKEVSEKYKPLYWPVDDTAKGLLDIVRDIEDNIDAVGADHLIKQYKKGLKRYRLRFNDATYLAQNVPYGPGKDLACVFEFWTRVYRFVIEYLEGLKSKPTKNEDTPTVLTFDSMFIKHEYIKPCLDVLRRMDPPFIDANNNYVGKNKGIFGLWIKILLRGYNGVTLINKLSDRECGQILNSEIHNLKLGKGYTELRKNYARLKSDKIERDIQVLLSQSSLIRKLRK